MPFPYTLNGPQFLLFFVLFVVAVTLIVRATYARREAPGERDVPRLNDPIFIAYLRGGALEALRVCMLQMTESGRLKFAADGVHAVPDLAPATDPLEIAVLRHFAKPRHFKLVDLAVQGPVAARLKAIRGELQRDGLLLRRLSADDHRLVPHLVGLCAIVGVALARYASTTPPFGFLNTLVAMSTIGYLGHYLVAKQTILGKRALSRLKGMMSPPRVWADRPAGSVPPAELVLVAAVFGAATMPAYAKDAYRWLMPSKGKSDGDGGGCGSSGCGSGDGGGGCGGGCGGGGGD